MMVDTLYDPAVYSILISDSIGIVDIPVTKRAYLSDLADLDKLTYDG